MEGEREQHEHAVFIWFFYFTLYFVDHYLKGLARRCMTPYMTTPMISRGAHEGQRTIYRDHMLEPSLIELVRRWAPEDDVGDAH